MIADALNKGTIDRAQLHELCAKDTWTIAQPIVSNTDVAKGRK